MKRGFLNKTPKSHPSTRDAVESAPKQKIEIPNVNLVEPSAPSTGQLPARSFNFNILALPRRPQTNEPMMLCLLYPGAREAILNIPDFPKPFVVSFFDDDVFDINDVPGMGEGMFASRTLNPGDLILQERPIFAMPVALPHVQGAASHPDDLLRTILSNLSTVSQSMFFSLANCKGSEVSKIRGICDTNLLHIGKFPGPYQGQYGALCLLLSKINHSCVPNAEHRWDLDSLTFQVRALRRIERGEQIFITYLNLCTPKKDRQSTLRSKYSFTCSCPSCSLPSVESTRSDVRRQLLHALDAYIPDNPADADADIMKWASDPNLPDDHVIKQSLKVTTLMEEEGIYIDSLWPFHYARLCKAYCALGDRESARLWARKAATLMVSFTGQDKGWNKVAEAPENTLWWRSRQTST